MKFGLKEKVLEQIQHVFSEFPQWEEAILYGSRAKGTHKDGSDIDLTLKGGSLNLEVLNQIRSKLDDLPLPYTFDLSIFSQIDNAELVDHIHRVGKCFYKR